MVTTAHNAYLAIRQMMLDGGFQPGQRISQSKLARELGCSTVPIVEAMRLLESDGLLIKEPRKMARFCNWSDDDRVAMCRVRESLESTAARLCAERISEAQFEHLWELAGQLEAAAEALDKVSFDHLDTELHRFIIECSGYRLLQNECARLYLIERTAGCTPDPTFGTQHKHSHYSVIKAIASRDPDAAEYAMKAHLRIGLASRVEARSATST